LDRLSQAARVVLKLDVGNAYTKLVVSGAGNANAYPVLRALSPEMVLSQRPSNPDEATAMLAGLWLWHDCLDESHKVSQSLNTVSGSMWHAIMHRREGDFSNSKYWYARCENHPALTTLAVKAADAINPFPADKRVLKITHHGWNADALVDLVEEVCDHPSDPRYGLAVALQQLEWRVLFDHCMRAAQ
jgi:hypothetical protein